MIQETNFQLVKPEVSISLVQERYLQKAIKSKSPGLINGCSAQPTETHICGDVPGTKFSVI